MRAIGLLRRNPLETAWAVFAGGNLAAMEIWPRWETVPFHFVWVSLTLLFGVRTWRASLTYVLLATVSLCTGALIVTDVVSEQQIWQELFEVPLMAAMFLAMVWHARRRQEALLLAERAAEERSALLEQQTRFLDDVSHELRTPVTIARGHLDVLVATGRSDEPEIGVAIDELSRIERVLERLLLLARAGEPSLHVTAPVEIEPFLEDVFMRWTEVATRGWRLGEIAEGVLEADPDGLRIAIDSLLENAVKYTEESDSIEVRSTARHGRLTIEVADSGCGVPADALPRIFERFARADPARTRAGGGVGLGLAIADAVAKAHGGGCSVRSSREGTVFALHLPGFTAAPAPAPAATPPVLPGRL
jgi:signal transduction histidine kinase